MSKGPALGVIAVVAALAAACVQDYDRVVVVVPAGSVGGTITVRLEGDAGVSKPIPTAGRVTIVFDGEHDGFTLVLVSEGCVVTIEVPRGATDVKIDECASTDAGSDAHADATTAPHDATRDSLASAMPDASADMKRDTAVSPCERYCTGVLATCPDEYPMGRTGCLAVCEAGIWEQGKPDPDRTNSVECRTLATPIAANDPVTWCPIAGPSGGGRCGNFCPNYCQVAQRFCPDNVEGGSLFACVRSGCRGLSAEGLTCRMNRMYDQLFGVADACAQGSLGPGSSCAP